MASLEINPSQPKYRPDIDGLRAIAVLAVVAFHAFPSWIKGGFIGVDVFFVISGYLISKIIFENLERGAFSLTEFYARRIKRIFPALLLVLVTCFAFGWFILLADEYKQLGRHIAGGASFISNLVLWNEAGYFDNSALSKPLLHLWSLGIEEQFYLLWPILLWLAWRHNFHTLTITIIVATLSFIINLKGIKHDLVATFYSPQSRFWELLSGSLLAWVSIHKKDTLSNIMGMINAWPFCIDHIEKQKSISKILANALSFTGIFLLVYGFWRIDTGLSYPGRWALVPVLGTLLIISAGSKAWVNRIILSNKVAIWFGLISYPLYLWHWPLIAFAGIVESEMPSREIRMGAVALSIALAWLTYKFVERPIRFGEHSKVKIKSLVFLMAIVGYIGYNTYERDGLTFRKSLANLSPPIERLGEDVKDAHNACLTTYGLSKLNIRFCRLSIFRNTKPHIALIGDSHAASLFTGLANALSKNNEGLLMMGGRLFIDVATYPDENEFEINVYKGGITATNFVSKEESIDTVIMASRGPFYINDGWNFYLVNNKKITDKRKVFEIGMRNTLNLMIRNNKKVIFVLDNPELGFDPKKCQEPRPLSTKKSFDCSIPRSTYDSRHKEYRELVLRILRDYPAVTVFDQSAYLCDEFMCRFRDGTAVLYGDNDHLSVRGSEFMANELIKVINGSFSKILY